MNFKSLIVISILALAGCGGGGGSTASNTSSTLSTAFIDAPVKGLTYISNPSGLTGLTDSAGTINYKDGDSVSLYLGGQSGLLLATFKPVTGSQVFVPALPNYGSIVQILMSLDGAQIGSSFMDMSNLTSILPLTKQQLSNFLATNSFSTIVLDDARAAIALQNPSLVYKNKSSASIVEANSHVDSSAALMVLPANNPLSSTYNKTYFNYVKTLTGLNAGEILSGFFVQKDPLNFESLSGDDGFISIKNSVPMSLTGSQAIIAGYVIGDTFSNVQQSLACPTSADFLSFTDEGNNYVQKVSQNTTGTGLCEQKELIQYRYALNNNFNVLSLMGKVITAKQSCGAATNTIYMSFDINGNYSITGNICSLKQQGLTVNVRDITNPAMPNGSAVDVQGFSGLIRLTPTGYDAVARAAHTPIMLLGKSITDGQIYFSMSDGGSPGLLAGGFMKLESIN